MYTVSWNKKGMILLDFLVPRQGIIREYSFTSLSQSLLRDTDEQVQASPDQGLTSPLSGGRRWTSPGATREVSQSLMARKQSFVWAYLEKDNHLRGYCT